MLLTEEEIRKIIRSRLIEATDGLEVAKDVGAGVAAGVGTAAALGAGLGVAGGAGATVGAVSGVTALGAGLGAGTGLAAMSTAGAVNFWNPVGWTLIGAAAVGTGLYFIFGDADGNEVVESVLSSPGNQLLNETQKLLADLEKQMSETSPENVPEGGFKHQQIPDSEIEAYVQALYAATKGKFFGTGLGTDEEGIRKVFNEIPTLMDVAIVSKYFYEDYSDAWTFDSNLYNVMINELGDSDFNKYVVRPLDPNKKPLLTLGGRSYTLEEIKNWGKDIKKAEEEIVSDVVLIDPNTLPGNLVQKIQHIMNKISAKNELGMTIEEDGRWGPQTDKMWGLVLNYAGNNPKIVGVEEFKSGFYPWKEVSLSLIERYPGYTDDTCGCLSFVTDVHNTSTEYGEGTKRPVCKGGSGGSGGGNQGGGRGRRSGGKDDTQQATRSGSVGSGLVPRIRVTLAGPGKNTLESLGFPGGTTSGLASTAATRVKGTITGGTINLSVVVARNGQVKNVRPANGQSRRMIRDQFEKLPNVVRRYLEKAGKIPVGNISAESKGGSKIVPGRAREKVRAKSRKFELVLDFPGGTY